MTIRIFTDGACRGNPGPGGWAALIQDDATGEAIEISGSEAETTNNRMELTAIIEALRRVPVDARVELYTDSQYVIRGVTEWLPGWRARGWRTTSGQPVKNRDLWEELDRLAGERVTWRYVRGHSGHPENERANALAQAAADRVGGRRASSEEVPPAPRVPSKTKGATYLSLVGGVLERHLTWEACRARVHKVSGARYRKCRTPEEEVETVISWGLDPRTLKALDAPGTASKDDPSAGGPA